GAATMDALDLRARIESCVEAILEHPAAGDIRVVGMAAFVGNMLGLGSAGEPVTPIYTYADTRSAEDVEHLKTRVDAESLHQRTGCLLHTAYQPGRLHWLRRTEPDLFAQVRLWTDFATYLYGNWFGAAACSYSVAAWTGMLNRAELTWNRQWLDVLGMSEAQFPTLADYDEMAHGLTETYAARWPALRDVPFCLAVGDGAAANIGSGCADESHIALTVGTTAALRLVSSEILPPAPPGLWSYRVDAAHHLIGGATSEGGNIFGWARDTLRLENTDDLNAALMNRAPDAHGLTFLPLLAGERSPGWAAHATGSVVGLRLSTTPLDILQAALEGVALRLSLIADQLKKLSGSEAMFMGGGGALAASPAWAHMIANALNRPLHITEETEITARGVAILALHALGEAALSAYPPAIAYTIEPIPAVAERLQAARERQVALYRKLILGEDAPGDV
ncbi:MAG: carbohydrate kinase, partial [Anaerolineae bacterium]|nr:carbohydrate kinase [Anaerolineae bacterium]